MKARFCGLSFWAFSMVAILGISPALAHADYSYSGTKWEISFELDRHFLYMFLTLGTDQGGGYYNVTALSGSDHVGIGGNVPLTLDGTSFMTLTGSPTDNLFNPSVAALPEFNVGGNPPQLFDAGGIAYFDGGDGGQPTAIYYNPAGYWNPNYPPVSGYQVCTATGSSCIGTIGQSVDFGWITENPEPPSWLLVGSGLPLLLYFYRKRNHRSRLSLL